MFYCGSVAKKPGVGSGGGGGVGGASSSNVTA